MWAAAPRHTTPSGQPRLSTVLTRVRKSSSGPECFAVYYQAVFLLQIR